MGIFKKTIKYSKPSKDLDHKIKNLDEELKQTGVIEDQNDPEVFVVQEEKELPKIYDEVEVEKKEESLYNWRETFAVEDIGEIQNIAEEVEYKTVQKVESYISESNRELIEIRDQVFQEISETTLLNLPEIKSKIEKVLEIYDQIQEGLLNEPPDVKNSDPLTPLDQKFVTVDELNKHYSLFINRIQEQLATVGGGGETKLKYLDDIVGIATNASAYNNKFLKYNHSLGKFEFASVGAGSQTLDDTLQLGNTSSLGMSVGVVTATFFVGDGSLLTNVPGSSNSGYANTAGIATYATTAGIATYASTAGIATYATRSGISTYASTAGLSTYASTSGIATYASTAGVSTSVIGGIASVTQLNVSGVSTFQAFNSYVEIGNPSYYAGLRLLSGGTEARILQSGSGDLYLDSYTNKNITLNTYSIFGDSVNAGNVQLNNGNQGNTKVGSAITFTSSTGRIAATSASLSELNVSGVSTLGSVGSATTNLVVTGYAKINGIVIKGYNTGSGDNIIISQNPADVLFTAGQNVAIGANSFTQPGAAADNVAIGAYALNSVGNNDIFNTWNGNIGIGAYAGLNCTTTIRNTFIGWSAGRYVTTGYENTIIGAYNGNQNGLDIRTSANNVVLSDGAGNIRFYANSSGNVGLGTINPTDRLTVKGTTSLENVTVSGVSTLTDTRINSVSEKTTLVSGNTVSLVYNTGGGNIAICTNPSGDVTLNVAGIPTDSNFDNRSLTFSVIVNNTGTARSCTAINLNGVSRTIKWFGGSLSAAISGVTTSSGYDIYNFTGINTVGSASTTANYEILGSVNGGYR